MNLDSLSDDDFKELLNNNHPELVIESIVRMNTGWSSYTFDVNNQYIFRFPRYEVVKNDYFKEMRLLPSLLKHMSVQVPDFSFIDRKVPYVGYKKIQGVPIVECDLSSDKLVQHLASVLLELHSFPVEKALELDVHLSDWRDEYEDLFLRARTKAFPHLESKTCELATEVFRTFLNDGRNFEFTPALIHRDLSAEEHILCNPDNSQITGIIDWEDSCVGDPAIDFTGLFWDCGEEFTRSVLRHYEKMGGKGPGVDPTFWERTLFYHKMVGFNILIHGLDTNNESIFKLGVEEVKKSMTQNLEKTWFEAFSRSMNVIFTNEDFQNYLADTESCIGFYRKYLGENTKILDLGCGLGTGSIPLSTFGYRITGIDNDEKVVEAARMNAKRFGKDVKIIQGDVFDIDRMFGPDSFDACLSGGLLEHFSEEQIQELIRKQLVVAPKLVAYMPIASNPGEKWNDEIYRNLWNEEYWLDEILKEFNVIQHSVARASEAIGGFLELEVVIVR